MIITFFFNYLNHHQVAVADEMYKILGNNFCFVATYPRDDRELKGGEDYSTRPYCILASESKTAEVRAHDLNKYSDVCVFGAGNLEWEIERAKTGKLTFEVGERWLKRGWKNMLSPRLLKWWWLHQSLFRRQPIYRLSASAFDARDNELLGCLKGKHFKWGYFTAVPEGYLRQKPREQNICVRIMWCARFIDWKHPELATECAKLLKEDGYRFHLDMYGDGELKNSQEAWSKRHGLEGIVTFHGNMPNEQILEAMKNCDIFLFTSDRQEGWGAVANEAMAAGCCLVGSDEIGAIPYLVLNGKNGLIFKSNNIGDLYQKVKSLIDAPKYRKQLAEQGCMDIHTLWNPKCAAERLIQLINDLKETGTTTLMDGPCSKT